LYSGKLRTADRDEVRAAFMRGDYQVIVTTDAGNEGIDLQAAHVLVNYDIPWSLVRLEQRMGRIHRVGQDRIVYLYNLVATDTREGDTLHALLESFVAAANELGGQIFDSLSVVAEMTGLQYERWLTDLFGDDESSKVTARLAVSKVHAADLKRAALIARNQESHLAVPVNAMAALTLLQQDLLERINPAIVESYLGRLDHAGLLTTKATAMGGGILLLTTEQPLPADLGGGTSTLVATSSEALRAHATSVDTSNVRPLGPGESAFTDLVDLASGVLAPDMFRGGAADDPTSITSYDLYAFEATLSEAGGKRNTAWAALIRVDDAGKSYPIRWESLANLVTTDKPGRAPHPARDDSGVKAARDLANETQARHQDVRSEWFAQARRDLSNLPIDLTVDIIGRDERIALRRHLEKQTAGRLAELETLSQVLISQPRLVARLRVHTGAIIPTAEEKDSEHIAMRHVQRILAADGWKVADVHSENRGYDLYAVRGREQRLIEVKGVWESAAADGIRMTGNEVLMATQHKREFWLYVVDSCRDGTGTLFGVFRDPATIFADDMRGLAVFRVPGSSLTRARRTNALDDGQEPRT
jgi:hypothetical protein